jgi:amino acid adenylation domain-containing protein
MCAIRENDVTNNEPSYGSCIAGAQAGSATSILNETSIHNGGRLSLAATIPRVEFRSDLPLSFAQEQLWFLAQMEGGSKAYQNLRCLHLLGELNRTALGQALNQIVARHEALRTVFAPVDGRPVQRIAGKHESHFHLIEHDLQECDQAAEELDRLVTEENRTHFDLETGPLIRGRLIRQAEQDHILLITIHHIISDAWSFGVFSNELSAIYSALARGEADPLPELTVQYADYAVWQRERVEGQILREQAEYWKTALAGAPALLQLPTDHIRPAQQSYRGALVELTLDEELTAGLKELGRRHGTTLFMTALAGWAAVLARLSGQQDVVIGTPTANRRRLEIEYLIGFFVNVLPFRLHVSDSLSIGELLAHVKSQVIAAQQHQDIPFERVVELARPVRSLSYNPVFQVMFSWQNAPKGTIELPGLQLCQLPSAPPGVSKFDLTLSLEEARNKIIGGVEYAAALFEPATVERYCGYFRTLLQAMVSDDTQEVGRLHILPERERRQVLYEWNATDVAYPAAGSRREKCVHELFEEQVKNTPDATAVVFENDFLSYAELNHRANRLAHYLRRLDIKPDKRVAICVERSLEMVIGLLAILKAGGAYVPLDPAYPTERLRQIIADAAPRIVLSDAIGRESLGAGALEEAPAIDLDTPSLWMELSAGNPDPRELGLTSRNLAYVIYTSGSTGTPKGVMVEHGNVVNFLCSMSAEPGITAQDRLLAVTNLSFDIAGLELYLPLSKGAQIVIAGRSTSADPYLLHRAVLNHRINMMQATPATWRALLDANLQRFPDLTILCGGEALTGDLSSRLPDQCKSAWNLYGPTETTIWSSYTRILRRENDLSANQCIGRPIGNTRIYILDGRGEPVPMGVTGELYIGGAGVARGYLNRHD